MNSSVLRFYSGSLWPLNSFSLPIDHALLVGIFLTLLHKLEDPFFLLILAYQFPVIFLLRIKAEPLSANPQLFTVSQASDSFPISL